MAGAEPSGECETVPDASLVAGEFHATVDTLPRAARISKSASSSLPDVWLFKVEQEDWPGCRCAALHTKDMWVEVLEGEEPDIKRLAVGGSIAVVCDRSATAVRKNSGNPKDRHLAWEVGIFAAEENVLQHLSRGTSETEMQKASATMTDELKSALIRRRTSSDSLVGSGGEHPLTVAAPTRSQPGRWSRSTSGGSENKSSGTRIAMFSERRNKVSEDMVGPTKQVMFKKLQNTPERRVVNDGIIWLFDELVVRRQVDITKVEKGRIQGNRAAAFERLFTNIIEIKVLPMSDVSALQFDLKFLSTEQLLFLRHSALSFNTDSEAFTAHLSFLRTVDMHFFEKLGRQCLRGREGLDLIGLQARLEARSEGVVQDQVLGRVAGARTEVKKELAASLRTLGYRIALVLGAVGQLAEVPFESRTKSSSSPKPGQAKGFAEPSLQSVKVEQAIAETSREVSRAEAIVSPKSKFTDFIESSSQSVSADTIVAEAELEYRTEAVVPLTAEPADSRELSSRSGPVEKAVAAAAFVPPKPKAIDSADFSSQSVSAEQAVAEVTSQKRIGAIVPRMLEAPDSAESTERVVCCGVKNVVADRESSVSYRDLVEQPSSASIKRTILRLIGYFVLLVVYLGTLVYRASLFDRYMGYAPKAFEL